jgi:hypothetical protein
VRSFHIDVVVELRKGSNDLHGRLLQFAHDYVHYTASDGRQLMQDDELARGAILCLSSTIIASSGERNRRYIPLTLVVNYAPYSLYTKWADEFASDAAKDEGTNNDNYDCPINSTQFGAPVDARGTDDFTDEFFLAENMPLGLESENLLNIVSETIVLGKSGEKQTLDNWWSDDEADDHPVEKKATPESPPPPAMDYDISDPITSESVLGMSPRRFLFTFFVHSTKKAGKDGARISPVEILRLYVEGKMKNNTQAIHRLCERMVQIFLPILLSS